MAILYTDACFLEHETRNHPESPKRLQSIFSRLDETRLTERFQTGIVQPATVEQLTRVHTPQHVEHVERFAREGGGRIEADTVMSRHSFDVALRAAGTAVAAVDQVIGGHHRHAVCLVRPPGHHALRDSAMGFCLFNNIAVAAAHAQKELGLSRILIVDWDVHHGNGTQDMFYESETIHFFSVHRSPFYPGSGSEDETGSGPGLGTILNLPLEFGISRHEYLERFQTSLELAARRSNPELILISAGFDAHAADPIGSLGLETEDFAKLTNLVSDVADHYCEGKIVSLLEGGYDVTALADAVECHLEQLSEND